VATTDTTTTDAPSFGTLDLDRLTLGEVAKIEELSGLPLQRIADEDAPKGKLLAALVFVAERRNGHAIAWPECMGLTTDEAMAKLGMNGDVEDQGAADVDEDADPEA